MIGALHLLTITIPWDPNIVKFGPFTLSWHGFFTAVGIALGVYLGAMLGKRQGFTEDDAYSIALVGVPGGIIGARLMFVLENKIRFEGHWIDALKVNEGGIDIYGAIYGGIIAAVLYGWIRKMPITRGLDVAAFGLLLGMAIGRIGDFINGEHIGTVSSLPWAVKYTNPNSPGYPFSATASGNFVARHPAASYEMIGDLLIIGIMALIFIKVWRTRPGITFFTGVVLYSAMRFGVSYLRIDSGPHCPALTGCPENVIKNWMSFPQAVSMITFAIGTPLLIWTIVRRPQPLKATAGAGGPPAVSQAARSRA
ncbi:MAG TPA: prolipoprotein diacylglyceryl transferase [Dehalococcoidia bacterium]|nr:prolipoprotein diacylglyceryl transferase [Dehalococcoidia bacterium]